MQRLRFCLAIGRAQLLQYYQGHIAALSVITGQGLRSLVALHHFRGFVGLNGCFEIELTEQRQLHRLHRLS